MLKYEAATVSVTVTSYVAQRPSRHGMSRVVNDNFQKYCRYSISIPAIKVSSIPIQTDKVLTLIPVLRY